MTDELELNKLLFRLSDIYNTEEIFFDNSIGETLIGKLILNRVVNIAYRNLMKSGAGLGEFSRPLKLMFEDNLRRGEECMANIEHVCRVFKDADFPFALLKGAYLIPFLYETGDRLSNDIDVLVNESNVGKCQKLLLENGFRQGYVNGGVFREATRREVIMSKMNYGETIPFVKNLEGHFIMVDINFSVDYKPMEDDGIITRMLEKRVSLPLNDTTLVTLDPSDFLIHLCLHLYKEATTWDWVMRRKDLNLYKFNDIYLLMRRNGSREFMEQLAFRIRDYGVEKECYFALFNTMIIYGFLNSMDGYREFLDGIRPEDTGYMKEIVNPIEKTVYRYDTEFLEWFSCNDRLLKLL